MSEQNPTKNENETLGQQVNRALKTPGHPSLEKPEHRMEKATPDNYETGTKREGETLTRAHQPPEFDLKK